MGNSKSVNMEDPTTKKQRNSTKSRRSRKVSEIKLTYYEEQDGQKRYSLDVSDFEQPGEIKRCRKHTTVCLDSGSIKVSRPSKEVVNYCIPLVTAHFVGQTTSILKTDIVQSSEIGNLHLGECLRVVDGYLRQFNSVYDFTGDDEYYLKLLSYIAKLRRLPDESEDECYLRLLSDSKRFVEIYHRRGLPSQELKDHKNYWGSRQQLLSGKVIADWVDRENGPLDPIFGALLQPTTGRAGPGDSGWFHQMVFDEAGFVAYHSAVHDAFGYLLNYHGIGPGYDYMYDSRFAKTNPIAGQIDGLAFWKNVLNTNGVKQNVMQLTNNAFDLFQLHSEINTSRRNTLIF